MNRRWAAGTGKRERRRSRARWRAARWEDARPHDGEAPLRVIDDVAGARARRQKETGQSPFCLSEPFRPFRPVTRGTVGAIVGTFMPPISAIGFMPFAGSMPSIGFIDPVIPRAQTGAADNGAMAKTR